MVYCDRSVQDAEEVKMNRIYTVAALALRRFLKERGAFKHDVTNAPTIVEADNKESEDKK